MSSRRRPSRLVAAVAIGAITIGLGLAGLAVAGGRLATDHQESLEALASASEGQHALGETLELLVGEEAAVRGFLLSGDDAFLAPFHASRERLPRALASARLHLTRTGRTDLADALAGAAEARTAYTDEVVAMIRAGDPEARRRVVTGEGRRLTNAVRAIVEQARAHWSVEGARAVERVQRSVTSFEAAFAALLLLAVSFAVAISWLMRRELHQERETARRTEEAQRLFRLLAERSPELTLIRSFDGPVEFASASSMQLLGYTPEELMAMEPGELMPSEDRAVFRQMVATAITRREAPPPITHRARRKDGGLRTFETRIDFTEDGYGGLARLLIVSRDVTDARAAEAVLVEHAAHDELTGLLNRRAFLERGTALLARCSGDRRAALLFFCDVNGLKAINDQLGHDAGDAVIRDVAQLLRATARDSDLVARLGGDEFVVLGGVASVAGADAFADRLRARIGDHNATASRPYRVSVSVGSATFEPGSGAALEELLASADAAMYAQKRHGRGSAATVSGESIVPKGDAPAGSGDAR